MELATQGARAKKGGAYNLPLDPRPTLDAIAQAVADTMEKKGITATIPPRPEPFGMGSAFRQDKWFATVPVYQHNGTSPLAPEPGVILDTPPRKKTVRPASTTLKPTRDWPRDSAQTAGNFCQGEDGCRYEPKRKPTGIPLLSGCNRMWRIHSRELRQAFIAANPEVMFRHQPLRCIWEIQPRHRYTYRTHAHVHDRPIAHAELCRLPDGRKFIISQPFCDDELCPECLVNIAKWQKDMPELRWTTGGRERSWYFPGKSNLLLLGTQDTLSSLDLNYHIPTGNAPKLCVRYPTHA